MRLAGRIAAMERRTPRVCPRCGPPWRFVVTPPQVVRHMSEAVVEGEQPGDRCPRCGRRRVLRITAPDVARIGGED